MLDIKLNHKINESDLAYTSWVYASIMHTGGDPLLHVRETHTGLIVTVKDYDIDKKQDLIDNLLNLHKKFGIKITFSKSLKISKNIAYNVGHLTPTQVEKLTA